MTKSDGDRSHSGNRQVIELLNRLGDRLIRNEKERLELKSTIKSLQYQMDTIEDTREIGETSFIKLQEQVNRALQSEETLAQRQDALEQKYESAI